MMCIWEIKCSVYLHVVMTTKSVPRCRSHVTILAFVWCDIAVWQFSCSSYMIMDTLVLRLSDSSHASSPPSGSKSVSNCHFIPLLSTPASLHGHSPTDTGTSPAVVVQKTSKNNEQSVPTDSDLSSVLKGHWWMHIVILCYYKKNW